jgi:hypothetical protein
VITQSRPTPRSAPPAVFPPPQTPPDNNPDTDMSAFMRKREAEREARQGVPGTAGGAPPGDKRLETALNNFNSLNPSQLGGTIEIGNLGTREGEFFFTYGFGYGKRRRQAFQVDAGPGGDIESAMLREMVTALRKINGAGDVSFESHRRNRIFVLSTRPEHSAQLEAILREEFFPRR